MYCVLETRKLHTGFLFVGRPEGKRPFGRPGRGWENNINSDIE